jgi:hypothetical protein
VSEAFGVGGEKPVSEPRSVIGDYLTEDHPVAVLWQDMLGILFRDRPARACPERLGPAARTLWHVGCFRQEVINGGFGQFLSNPSGDHAQESLDALRRVGAVLSTQLLEEALAGFPGGVAPTDHQERNALLRAFEARQPRFLWELTKDFYKRADVLGSQREEDLNALQVAFMRQHRSQSVQAELSAPPDRGDIGS